MEPERISLSQHMMTYQKMLFDLVCEKPNMTPEKKAQKESDLRKIVNEKFAIIGDEAFCARINADLNQILSVKPGRKLIKALSKHDQKITIQAGPESHFNPKTFSVSFDIFASKDQYTSLYNWSIQRPLGTTLAHELIHAYHKFVNQYESYGPKANCVIKDMDNLKEQDAIVGMWWYSDVHHKIIKNKTDVLCENAFLIALNCPPRVDHSEAGQIPVDVNYHNNCMPVAVICNYYSWLEISLEVASVAQKYRDNPLELPAISENSLNNPYFMDCLFIEEPGLMKFFPAFLNNKEYLLNIFEKNLSAIMHFESELSSDFNWDALFILKPQLIVHCPTRRKDLKFMSSIVEKSPEIIAYLQKEDLEDPGLAIKCAKILVSLPSLTIVYNNCFLIKSIIEGSIRLDFVASEPEIQINEQQRTVMDKMDAKDVKPDFYLN